MCSLSCYWRYHKTEERIKENDTDPLVVTHLSILRLIVMVHYPDTELICHENQMINHVPNIRRPMIDVEFLKAFLLIKISVFP